MTLFLHHIFIESVVLGDLSLYIFCIDFEPIHIGSNVNKSYSVFEVDYAVGLGDAVDADVEIIESVFEY